MTHHGNPGGTSPATHGLTYRAPWSRRLTARDRRMLAGAYWPVIAFAALLITARTPRRRHRQECAVQ